MAKEQWGSRIGVILAVAGSAVGLGNFLRFPGQAAANGGGAFMIPYFVCLLLVGIPICWAEWTMGRQGGRYGVNSCPAVLGALGGSRAWSYFGVLGLLIPVGIYAYYNVIEAWCLGYAWKYLTGEIVVSANLNSSIGDQTSKMFATFTGQDENGSLFGGQSSLVLFWVVVFSLNFVLAFRGLSKGIEWFCVRAMPIMTICAIVVLIRVLTLGPQEVDGQTYSVQDGLGYLWNPGGAAAEGEAWYAAILRPQAWLAAAGQIFFSLSVGFGVIINYASYLKRKDDVVLSGLTATSTNEFFEVCLGGLITVPAAFLFLGAAGATKGTFGMGFESLPAVFLHMGPAGRWIGATWFFMLFLAAITSSLSMLQPAIAFLEESLGIGRRASVTLLGGIAGIGSLIVLYFSENMAALDTIDYWAGTFAIVILATVQVVLFGWVIGVEKGFKMAHEGAEMRIPSIFKFIIKYVSPLFLVVILTSAVLTDILGIDLSKIHPNLPPAPAQSRIQQLVTSPVAQISIGFVLTLIVMFTVLVTLGNQRLRKLGLGQRLLDEGSEA